MTRVDEITIISRNFDGSERRRWIAELSRYSPPLIELIGVFDRDVIHSELGLIEKGTISHEFYWIDRWYNIFRFHNPNGQFRNFYCNINCPPTFDRKTLDYIDLDIDVVWGTDGKVSVLDENEFQENCAKFSIPQTIQDEARKALNQVLEMIERREFPFDHFG